jgi:hypothetical protein
MLDLNSELTPFSEPNRRITTSSTLAADAMLLTLTGTKEPLMYAIIKISK